MYSIYVYIIIYISMKLLHKLSSGSGLVTFALALIIVFLAFLGVSYILEKPPVVKDLKLTNISDSSVTVTYMTEEATVGSVIVSTSNNFDVLGQFSKAKFYDDRGDGVARKTHHVTIKGMLPEALYYFRISSGFKNADTTYPNIETASTPDTLRTPDPSYAKLTNQTNSDALVFFTLNNGTPQSTYLNSDSAFTIDKANIKTADLKESITYKEGDEINITVVDGGKSVRTLKTKVGEDQPINMQGFIDQTDGTSSTNLNKSLVSGVYAAGCDVSEYPERYCQETKDGLCCKSAVRTIRKNADCSYSTTGDGMDSQSHDCNAKKTTEVVANNSNASNSGQSNEADKGCGSNRVVTYKKDKHCDTGKKIFVWVNEVCSNGKITLQPGDATSEACGEVTKTQSGGLSTGGLSQTTQEAAKKAEEAAKTPKDSGAKPQEGVLDPKTVEALKELCKTVTTLGGIVTGSDGCEYACVYGNPTRTTKSCPSESLDPICGGLPDSKPGTACGSVPKVAVKYKFSCPNGNKTVKATITQEKCATTEVNYDSLCVSDNTKPVCNPVDGNMYSCQGGKATKTDNKCPGDDANMLFKEYQEQCKSEESKQTLGKFIQCSGTVAKPYEYVKYDVTYVSKVTKGTLTKSCEVLKYTGESTDCSLIDKLCTENRGCTEKVAKKSSADGSVDGDITNAGDVAVTLLPRDCTESLDSGCGPKSDGDVSGAHECKSGSVINLCCDPEGTVRTDAQGKYCNYPIKETKETPKPKGGCNDISSCTPVSTWGSNGAPAGSDSCTEDGIEYSCCPGGTYPIDPVTQKTICKKGSAGLNNKIVSPASAQAVLGTSDSTATEVKVDSTGKYKVTDVKGYQIVNSEVWVLDTGTASTGSLKFFEDKNRNSVKDEGEEYITTPLEVKVEKQSDVVKYEFVAGWNLISYNLAEGSTASKLISSINGFGGYATHVATYVAGSWMMYSERAGQKLGNDFKLVPGQGYFVKVIKPVTMYIEGKLIEKDQSIYLNTGWNLVGLRSTVTGAKNLIEEVNKTTVLNLDTVTRLEGGRYENLVSDGTTYYGNDFALKSESGYFVRLKKGGASWKK